MPATTTLRVAASATLLLLAAACSTTPSPPQYYETRGSRSSSSTPTAVQALIGAALYDDMTVEASDPNDPSNTATAEISQMPLLGFAGHYRLTDRDSDLEAGLDGSLLFSWASDNTEVRAVGGGTVIVSVSMRMFLTDIGFGGYVSKLVNDSIRLYAAAGPLLMFGNGSYSDEFGGDSESAFGVGGYVRGGAEFRLDRASFLGLGVRGVASNLDFGGALGDVNADGVQFMLTFTQGF